MMYINKTKPSDYRMIELIRELHPVGQGGFYTETFNNNCDDSVFRMVYDCGSETNKPRDISTYLDSYFAKNDDKIDAVFISHLHDDHINGLDNLLRKGVKYLFLPQLTPNVIIEAYLYNWIKIGRFNNPSNNIITNLINRDIGQTKIIEINEINDNEDDTLGDVDFNDNNKLTRNGAYNSGTRFTISTNIYGVNGEYITWLYIPFNSPCKTKNGKDLSNDSFFKDVIDAHGKIIPDKLQDLITPKSIEECKKIYKNYFGSNHNEYSMTLFSGLEYSCIKDDERKPYCYNRRRNNINKSPNFLYTGDFVPRATYINKMINSLGILWETISGIQVPHHGSKNNFDLRLYKNPCKAYVSYGSGNNYHHPHDDTKNGIRAEGCLLYEVTEDSNSYQKIRYYIDMKGIG